MERGKIFEFGAFWDLKIASKQCNVTCGSGPSCGYAGFSISGGAAYGTSSRFLKD